MGRPRAFDHDEARRLRAEGRTYTAIADALGVSITSVQRACDDGYRERQNVASVARLYNATCPDCGGARNRYHDRCWHCAMTAMGTTARATELQCKRCREWKPDHAFQSCRANKIARRGRHDFCRACSTIARREHRQRNRAATRAYDREYKRRRRASLSPAEGTGT